MSIRIFSKKTFAIGPGAQRGSTEVDYFVTIPLSFQDMPEKYTKDPTFLAACKSGDIEVVNKDTQVSTAAPKALPVEEVTPVEEEAEVEEVQAEEELSEEEYKEKLKAMNKSEVKAEAEKYGAEFVEEDKLSQNKKRVMEAYKLSKEN